MTQNIPLNPMELWSRALTEWENSMNSLANKGTKTDAFNRTMQKASSVALGLQHQVDQANIKLLTAMNLPSRQQVEELDNRLAKIEDMLRLLLEKSGVATGVAAALPDEARPRRTRLPPAALAAVPEPAAPKAAPARARKAAR